jgi:hypothetical protein
VRGTRMIAVLAAAMAVPAPAALADTTAWSNGHFDVDTANVVRRSNIILEQAPATGPLSMPVGNGVMGAAVWAQQGFTAQLERADTFPTRRSPGQVVIPGLQAMTGAADYKASVDLYDATYRQSGGGMTATTYVRADKDELVVDVTGADPASAQTAQVNLQAGRTPQAGSSNGIARLAETWVDTGSASGGTGKTFGSLAAITAGGRGVVSSVIDARTAQVGFRPNIDGSFRVVVSVPHWTGGDAAATAAATLGSDATAPADALRSAHLAWWHDYWSKVGLMKLTSADGTADYMENLRTIFLYVEGASERDTFPSSQAGVADMFNFSRDQQSWGGGHYWFWNMRMQIAANIGAGNTAMNAPRFRLYHDNLDAIRAWTTLRMGGRPGICIPETMRFDGTGWYTGTDEGNTSCDSVGAESYNKRNITTASEVASWIWRTYQATDDRAFLEAEYPIIADAARFLLAYSTTGTDGKLHTFPSNAHESQWDVHDPITDIAAMKQLFPIVVESAMLLGKDSDLVAQVQAAMPKVLDFPRTDASTHTQLKTAAGDSDGNTVLGFSSDPAAPFRNSENLDLEPVWPYNLISDQSPLWNLAKTTYARRRNINSNDWTYDPVQAARLGMGSEVASRLRASTSSFQLFADGLANLGSGGNLTEPYDEQVGVAALALNESLAQDFDGLLRIAPAVPPGWDAEGTVFLQHRSKVDVQVQGGTITTVAIESGAAHDIRVKNPWPGQGVQVVDGTDTGTVVVPTTTADTFTIAGADGGKYLVQRASAPTTALPKAQITGTPATKTRHLAQSNARIGIDPVGYEPPGPCATPAGPTVVAWDPISGDTIKDWSSYGRNGAFAGGPATYLATGPTGSSASIDGGRYLRTPATTLGYLREATFATEIKINPGSSYRRIWDWKTASGGDADGILIDLTPSGALRVITSGSGVTTTAVLPTGRFIDLVIAFQRTGAFNVYVDGTRLGGGTYNSGFGINGCAGGEYRIGADQAGGQRISAEVDRTAVFTKALSAGERANWQKLAFVDKVDQPVEIGGSVPAVLALAVSPAPSFGIFVPGRTQEYTASATANVTSTATNATLTVADASAAAPGHLVNGSHTMPQALQVKAGGAFTPVGASPTGLASWTAPVSGDTVGIDFKQPIAAADALYAGTYAKTLTFTLSTTMP